MPRRGPTVKNTREVAEVLGAPVPLLRAVNRRDVGAIRPSCSRTPGATIYSFDRVPAAAVEYGELEHVVLTRDFLNHPERYLRALREPR